MKHLSYIILCMLGLQLTAQSNCSSSRYIDEVFTNTNSIQNIQFGQSDPYGLITNQDLYLDIIEPTGDTLEKRPLILHQFGGGFLIGWRTEPVIPQMSEMYAKRGFVFATIDYRLGFNPLDGESAERAVYRAALDLNAALRYLVDNADIYGIDTSAIFLTGTSAGCFAAFVTTFMEESDRADIPSTYGIPLEPADLGCFHCSGNNNYNNQKVPVHGIINNWGAILDTNYINPATTSSDNVPVISFHGTDDLIVPYAGGNPFSVPIFPYVMGSSLIHQRLDNVGVKNKLYPLQGLGHEPQLLQLQTWVTDTIISHGSQFLYEIMYGDSVAITGDSTVCLNTTTNYSVPFNTGSSYCWDLGSGGVIVSQNQHTVNVLWQTTGQHTLTAYELDKREISKVAQLQVSVQAPPSILLTYSSTDGLFNFTCNNNANQFIWNFGDGQMGTGSPTSHQYTDTGMYSLQLGINNGYCVAIMDTNIRSTLCPIANFSYVQNDSSYTFTNTSNFADSCYWITSDGTILTGNQIELDILTEGNYSLSLIAINDFCSDTYTHTVPMFYCSHANFSYVANQLNTSFTDLSHNAYFYAWQFGDGTNSSLPNPNHTYSSPGSYICQLTTTSLQGCSNTVQKLIEVDIQSGIDTKNALNLSFWPNPFQNQIYIVGLNPLENYQYELVSMEGKTLSSGNLQNNTINCKNISNGVYLLQISSSKQITTTKILLKQ